MKYCNCVWDRIVVLEFWDCLGSVRNLNTVTMIVDVQGVSPWGIYCLLWPAGLNDRLSRLLAPPGLIIVSETTSSLLLSMIIPAFSWGISANCILGMTPWQWGGVFQDYVFLMERRSNAGNHTNKPGLFSKGEPLVTSTHRCYTNCTNVLVNYLSSTFYRELLISLSFAQNGYCPLIVYCRKDFLPQYSSNSAGAQNISFLGEFSWGYQLREPLGGKFFTREEVEWWHLGYGSSITIWIA